MIRENLARVFERIEKACGRAGRRKEEVHLVAVTKTVPPEKILEAARSGVNQIGENRVQESQDKYQAVQASCALKWHMIGRLQRNKVNRAVEIFDMIQSVDSLKLAQAIDRRAGDLGKVEDCLVELKVSEEKTKSGLEEKDLEFFLKGCESLKRLRLLGLMTLAPFFEDPEESRPYFSRARKIFETHFKDNPNAVLSMGMSGDFEVAIQEGSTMVRIGRAIFGERNK